MTASRPHRPSLWHRYVRAPAAARLAVSFVVGLAVALVVGLTVNLPLAVLSGIVALALTFVVTGVVALWPMDAKETRKHARREDFRPKFDELLVTGVSVMALVGIVVITVAGGTELRVIAATLGLVGVFLSWGMLHLMYSARYAYLYYREPVGGIDFNTKEEPSFIDFFYFSFNLGMTYQVSDTGVSTTRLRAVILRHCLLSYVFGTVIIASTINLVAGVLTS